MYENRDPTMYNGRLNRAVKALSVAIELSAGILRKFIGIELDDKYYEIAKNRINVVL